MKTLRFMLLDIKGIYTQVIRRRQWGYTLTKGRIFEESERILLPVMPLRQRWGIWTFDNEILKQTLCRFNRHRWNEWMDPETQEIMAIDCQYCLRSKK